ncbi:hypothetical protein [Pseudomonas phage vB_Pae_SG_WM_Sew_P15]
MHTLHRRSSTTVRRWAEISHQDALLPF